MEFFKNKSINKVVNDLLTIRSFHADREDGQRLIDAALREYTNIPASTLACWGSVER